MKKGTAIDMQFDLARGEGQFVEFKESLDKSFAKELVAFANASGGVVYLGVKDNGKIKGIDITNRLKSQVQDMARNCDPTMNRYAATLTGGILTARNLNTI
jgi:ATP-dependent DNA helicase RecG